MAAENIKAESRTASRWQADLLDFKAGDGCNLGGHVGQGMAAIPVDELLVVVHEGHRAQALAEAAAEDHLPRYVVGRLDVPSAGCGHIASAQQQLLCTPAQHHHLLTCHD